MKKYMFFVLGWFTLCLGREPFKPREGSVPFMVYFLSHYRGICMGTLVSRTAVLTAAVCVVNPAIPYHDTRPVNVITATYYRHPRRGIRVQVTKIIIPKLSNATAERAYMIQEAPAVLLLARQVPDVLAEIPLRALQIDYNGEEILSLHEECLAVGWHFFYKGDKIYPTNKFLLQRQVRTQYLVIAKKNVWCNAIKLRFQKAMANLGYMGNFDKTATVCLKDGMYGAPLICNGKAVGMLMAPDAQWSNCTGFTSLFNIFKSDHISSYMNCVSSLFKPELAMNWEKFKNSLKYAENDPHYDYLPEMYDKVVFSSSSSEET
ncbi:hypothetical protein KGM_207168 [Danaus plexippus plexippus]|uniref:Peptidase S1 domain-containing protein n=1 Tax=Danaus plexippus plexippus TaxID=278856 RepID=A0A212EMN3_DANPL|nr:hypothetical protein KGM_207168 [Danaus plexippus plexippus]